MNSSKFFSTLTILDGMNWKRHRIFSLIFLTYLFICCSIVVWKGSYIWFKWRLTSFVNGILLGTAFFAYEYLLSFTSKGRRLITLMQELTGGFSLFELIVILISGAVTEELLFRGILLKFFLSLSGPAAAIALTGILFGLLHGFFSKEMWLWSLSASLFGVLAGTAVFFEKNVLPGVIAHVVANLEAGFYLRYRRR